MREKIDRIVDYIKQKETRKKYAPIFMAVGFALLVASAVLLILSVVGFIIPGFDGVNFYTAFKIAGLGIFSALVGRQWSAIRLDPEKKMTEEEAIKYLEGQEEDTLELENIEETLDLQEKEILDLETEEPLETKNKS